MNKKTARLAVNAGPPEVVGESLVRQVLLCERYPRRPSHEVIISVGYPGHLLQLAVAGQVEYEVGGRKYMLRPGDLIWHHELETVKRRILKGHWECYAVNFLAPDLPPPPFDRRVRHVGGAIERRFAALLAAWRRKTDPPVVRQLRVRAMLEMLLADLLTAPADRSERSFQIEPAAQLWWKLESQLRDRLAEPMNLRGMIALTGHSPATIARACHAAVGLAPMKRFKQLRLDLARSLVERSRMNFGEIAAHVGYERQHEFSRDYRKAYGAAPRDHRRAAMPCA